MDGGEHGGRIARGYQVVKYFAGNGGNWRLNGCGGGVNGFRGFETSKKKAKSKPAPLKPKGAAPPTVLAR